MKTILILGATSPIARIAAQALAEQGYALYLAGRNVDELERIASDIRIKTGAAVQTGCFEAEDFSSHPLFLHEVLRQTGGIAGALLAVGTIGEHQEAIRDFQKAERMFAINFLGPCSILTHLANYLADKKTGFLAVITSVAGDRGRQSNYVYGSAKGGLSIFLQGLRNRLHQDGVNVLTIKPGYVDTAMTFGKKGIFLAASPDKIGRSIVKAVQSGRNEVYLPWYWRSIMAIIKNVPECIFKRLKL